MFRTRQAEEPLRLRCNNSSIDKNALQWYNVKCNETLTLTDVLFRLFKLSAGNKEMKEFFVIPISNKGKE